MNSERYQIVGSAGDVLDTAGTRERAMIFARWRARRDAVRIFDTAARQGHPNEWALDSAGQPLTIGRRASK